MRVTGLAVIAEQNYPRARRRLCYRHILKPSIYHFQIFGIDQHTSLLSPPLRHRRAII